MTDYIVVKRTVAIDALTPTILPLITDFHEWAAWSPWEDIDPQMQRSYSGPESGVGASYAWSGNRKAGAGTMRIDAVDTSSVDIALTFTRPFKSQSKCHFDLVMADAGTSVTWQILTPKTLMLRVASLFMSLEKTVGPDLEKGLLQLKAAAERAS